MVNKTENTQFDLVYKAKSKTWSVKSGDKFADLIQFNEDGTIDVTMKNGDKLNVSQNEEGVEQVRQMAMDFMYAAN